MRDALRKKKGDPALALAARECLGRGRGGLTTKLHLASDGRDRPLALHPGEGQRHDSQELERVWERIRVPRCRGRPRKRPDCVCLDKGSSYPRCRQLLRRRKLRHIIPERRDQQAARQRKGSRGGRPPGFAPEVYAARNWVERVINRLKQFRGVATRYDKRGSSYLAMATLAAIKIWISH